MFKSGALLFSFLFLFSFASALIDGDGDGYLEIHNCVELQSVNDNLTTNYELMNNIDCSDTKNWKYRRNGAHAYQDSIGFEPLGSFSGVFNGNSYTISNLVIRPDQNSPPVGLFSQVTGSRGLVFENGRYYPLMGIITNIGLINTTVVGQSHIGSFVGIMDGALINCYSTGGVVQGGAAGRVGGLVGELGGSIVNSYFEGNVSADWGVGGIVGLINHGSIESSYSIAQVAGGRAVGGLVGQMYGSSVKNSYSIGIVNAYRYSYDRYGNESRIAGLVGDFSNFYFGDAGRKGNSLINSYSVTFVNMSKPFNGLVNGDAANTIFGSYYDKEAISSFGGGLLDDNPTRAKITSEMKTKSTYVGWDFDNVWDIGPAINNGYPYLRRAQVVNLLPNLNPILGIASVGGSTQNISSCPVSITNNSSCNCPEYVGQNCSLSEEGLSNSDFIIDCSYCGNLSIKDTNNSVNLTKICNVVSSAKNCSEKIGYSNKGTVVGENDWLIIGLIISCLFILVFISTTIYFYNKSRN